MKIEKSLEDSAEITDTSPTCFAESAYLPMSHRKRCTTLLRKHPLSENDIMDIYISLQIVLETSLNSLFRHTSLRQIKKPINRMEVIENLDKINFRDKVTLFIYNSTFDFEGDLEEAAEHHKIIGKLRNFSEVRNRLLHGHSISTIFTSGHDQENRQHSRTRELLSSRRGLEDQINLFRQIIKGLRFYVDHLVNLDAASKKLALFFLRDDFLTEVDNAS